MALTKTKFMHSVAAVLGSAMLVSACVISVDHGNDHDDHYRTALKVKLDNGDYHRVRCPRGYAPFLKEDDSGNQTFGCSEKETD